MTDIPLGAPDPYGRAESVSQVHIDVKGPAGSGKSIVLEMVAQALCAKGISTAAFTEGGYYLMGDGPLGWRRTSKQEASIAQVLLFEKQENLR